VPKENQETMMTKKRSGKMADSLERKKQKEQRKP
jgi:hypothetical protein